jgi:hypothetical protein
VESNGQQCGKTSSKNPNVAIETWSSKIFAKTQSNETSNREIERVRESGMEMSEAESRGINAVTVSG